jgi:hypothetical protein
MQYAKFITKPVALPWWRSHWADASDTRATLPAIMVIATPTANPPTATTAILAATTVVRVTANGNTIPRITATLPTAAATNAPGRTSEPPSSRQAEAALGEASY